MQSSQLSGAPRRRFSNLVARRIVVLLSVVSAGLAVITSCGSSGSGNPGLSPPGGEASSGSNGGSGSSASNGGNGSSASNGGNGSGVSNGGNGGGNGSGASNGGNGSGANGGTGSGGNGSGASNGGSGSAGNGGTGSGANGSSGTSSNGSNGGNGSGSGVTDAGGGADSGLGGGPDAGVVCTGTDKTTLVPNATGWEDETCNSWGIQGSWYCYADGIGIDHGGDPTSGPDCKTTGVVPYTANTPGPGMCISGTTGTTTAAWGAGLGLVMSQATHDAGKAPFNATAKSIIGFAITLAGTSGGSDLRAYFNTDTSNTTEYPYVGLPGLASGNSPITYNVLFSDAVVSDDPTSTLVVPNPADIYDVQVRIHGGGGNTYSFCITSIKPITAAPTVAGSCSAATNFGPSFCNQTAEYIEDLGSLAVQNDWFGNGGTACVQAMGGGGTCAGLSATYTGLNGGNTTQVYPSLVYGWQFGHFYGGYRTAKQLSAVSSASATWTYTAPTGGNYDVAWDMWIGGSANPQNRNGLVEVMVWNGWNGVQPAGSMSTTATIDGQSWEVWKGSMTGSVGGSESWQYLAYRNTASKGSGTVTYDLSKFFADAEGEGVGISASSYLLSIEAGAELYTGSGTFTTSSYTVSVP
jgi:hypothetical protein